MINASAGLDHTCNRGLFQDTVINQEVLAVGRATESNKTTRRHRS